jgi:CheY-like chemotaxis protein
MKPPKFARRRVLIVDDNADMVNLLSILVKLEGHETEVAYDATEALRKAEVFKPDLALLDIGLPGISGYELAKTLRANPQLRQARLVAVTGFGEAADYQRSLAAGFDSHVVKPVGVTALVSILEGLASHGRDRGSSGSEH